MLFTEKELKELETILDIRLSHYKGGFLRCAKGSWKENPERKKLAGYYKNKIELINNIKNKLNIK